MCWVRVSIKIHPLLDGVFLRCILVVTGVVRSLLMWWNGDGADDDDAPANGADTRPHSVPPSSAPI